MDRQPCGNDTPLGMVNITTPAVSWREAARSVSCLSHIKPACCPMALGYAWRLLRNFRNNPEWWEFPTLTATREAAAP
jgi:hypothetical protein